MGGADICNILILFAYFKVYLRISTFICEISHLFAFPQLNPFYRDPYSSKKETKAQTLISFLNALNGYQIKTSSKLCARSACYRAPFDCVRLTRGLPQHQTLLAGFSDSSAELVIYLHLIYYDSYSIPSTSIRIHSKVWLIAGIL